MAQDGSGVNGNNGRRSAGNGGVYTGSQQSMYYRGPDGKIYMRQNPPRRTGVSYGRTGAQARPGTGTSYGNGAQAAGSAGNARQGSASRPSAGNWSAYDAQSARSAEEARRRAEAEAAEQRRRAARASVELEDDDLWDDGGDDYRQYSRPARSARASERAAAGRSRRTEAARGREERARREAAAEEKRRAQQAQAERRARAAEAEKRARAAEAEKRAREEQRRQAARREAEEEERLARAAKYKRGADDYDRYGEYEDLGAPEEEEPIRVPNASAGRGDRGGGRAGGSGGGSRPPKKKKKKSQNTFTKVVFALILLLGLVLTVGVVFIQSKLNKINRVDKETESQVAREDETFERDEEASEDTMKADEVDFNKVDINVMEDADVKNILLIGQDRRDGEGRTRSDSMIIVSVSKDANKLILNSIMRDMYVPIEGYSDNRINSAYQLGGMTLLDKVIENDFGIHIDGNVEVDFDGFIETMTQIGDLEIELKAEEAEFLMNHEWVTDAGFDNEDWDLHEGINSLNPDQALAYARMRYVGNSDFERTDRQRRIIVTAFDKVKGMSVNELLKLADKLFPYFTTDLDNDEMLGYVYTVATNHMSIGESHRIPVPGTYEDQTINGMMVLVPDLQANSEYLQEYIYHPASDEEEEESEESGES